jgi:hypothetical protein
MTGPALDSWTTVVAMNTGRLAITLVAASYARFHKTYPGFVQWVGGMGVGALSLFCMALFPFHPGLSVVLTNLCNSLQILLILDGTRRFVLGLPLDRRWYLFPALHAAVGSCFYFGVDSLLARIWWNTLVMGGVSLACGLIWLQNRTGGAERLSRAVACLSFVYGGVLFARALGWRLVPGAHSLFQSGAPEAVSFLVMGMLDLSLLAFLPMLNSQRLESDLRESTARLRLLTGILPICSRCKKIRDDEGAWTPVEQYVRHRTDADFSHGVCPECFQVLYPDFADLSENHGAGE